MGIAFAFQKIIAVPHLKKSYHIICDQKNMTFDNKQNALNQVIHKQYYSDLFLNWRNLFTEIPDKRQQS